MEKRINNLVVLDSKINQELKMLALKNNKTKGEMASFIIEEYIMKNNQK